MLGVMTGQRGTTSKLEMKKETSTGAEQAKRESKIKKNEIRVIKIVTLATGRIGAKVRLGVCDNLFQARHQSL